MDLQTKIGALQQSINSHLVDNKPLCCHCGVPGVHWLGKKNCPWKKAKEAALKYIKEKAAHREGAHMNKVHEGAREW